MRDILEAIRYFSEATPNKNAVQHQNDALTYSELEAYSNQLAIQLKDETQPIVVYGHMSSYMIVGMIAALKAGCGYVPIDYSIPVNRIESIVNRIQPSLFLNTMSETMTLDHVKVVDIETLNLTGVETHVSNIQPDTIAYTIFTSGSTGEPKGVQIYYDSLVDFANWVDDLNQNKEGQVWLNQAPLSFDLSVMSVYPALVSGGTIQFVSKDMIINPKALHELFISQPIDVWVSTPSFMEMCLLLPSFNEEQMSNLSTFLFCGEVFGHKSAQRLLKQFPQSTIYNTYGPTEATVAITSIRVTHDVLEQFESVPIGKPRPGVNLRLTEENELVIEGSCVSAGYVKDEERSARVFFETNETRGYFTGDSAKFVDDQWFIQGRIDNQIKYNGYRMELEEIEAKLNRLDEINSAMVVPVRKNNKVKLLKGVLQLSSPELDEKDAIKSIKSRIKEELPDYMIPQQWVCVEQMPLNNNGKIDRKMINEVYQS
ncbi:D-alanine--poly(phosphoribitol) ligase subunit DltA [Staphylococcus hyicus]|uniref:D-alanine--poly(phosphoribitol) ligase subunit DltA n=1 Tax=Staphylococcus hyicus TaxID=1284 RepID=UPI00211B8EE7|nr:D-alanine--poly(phosphoribitol) ligase subunit DltA [Staphylococcus hyicus]MCQ9300574.1 D-alanine--poly(phosphoribitol) ligase subunit DltA [Staphylococcus hyicus]